MAHSSARSWVSRLLLGAHVTCGHVTTRGPLTATWRLSMEHTSDSCIETRTLFWSCLPWVWVIVLLQLIDSCTLYICAYIRGVHTNNKMYSYSHAALMCVSRALYACMYACMHAHACMCVCMCVCVCVCMYVCVYVCMYVCVGVLSVLAQDIQCLVCIISDSV